MPDVSELFSAYLDGELGSSERAAVEARLKESADARRDLAELGATRGLVRSLPVLEPPSRFLSVPAAPPRRPRLRRLAVAALAAAAVWVLVVAVGLGLGSVPLVPDVDALRAQHAAAAPREGFVAMSMEDLDDPAVMSDIGHDMVLSDLFASGDLVHARYSDGDHAVSVFHEPGRVGWDDLAGSGSGSLKMMGGGPLWWGETGGSDVLVFERGDLVVTVVVDAGLGDDMAMAVVDMVPPVEVSESLWSRLVDAPGNVIDRVG